MKALIVPLRSHEMPHLFVPSLSSTPRRVLGHCVYSLSRVWGLPRYGDVLPSVVVQWQAVAVVGRSMLATRTAEAAIASALMLLNWKSIGGVVDGMMVGDGCASK